MTFFPMLVNTVAGLASAGHLERDLMRSYGASWSRTLLALRLPAAMPFIFNALKINATLAMIARDRGRVFRHANRRHGLPDFHEVGRMAVDMVLGDDRDCGHRGFVLLCLAGSRRGRVTFLAPLQPAEIESTVYTSRASSDAGQQGRA